jgi:hypothetical protein
MGNSYQGRNEAFPAGHSRPRVVVQGWSRPQPKTDSWFWSTATSLSRPMPVVSQDRRT